MDLMKKDMGGAALAIALADALMDAGLDIRLRLMVGAVENAIGPNAFRPGDVLASRKGLSVEIGNTDAEGRLVLADMLAEADGEEPQVMVDFATLTGAARVAMGPEVVPFYTRSDTLAAGMAQRRRRRAIRCGACPCGTAMPAGWTARSPMSAIFHRRRWAAPSPRLCFSTASLTIAPTGCIAMSMRGA